MTRARDRLGACFMVLSLVAQGALSTAEGVDLVTALLSAWVRA